MSRREFPAAIVLTLSIARFTASLKTKLLAGHDNGQVSYGFKY
jgi:hypothetical protein